MSNQMPFNPFIDEDLLMNKKTILVTGVFHILHPGHVDLLKYCSTLGTVVVGINTDKYIIEHKKNKVLIPLVDRIYLLKSIRYVDHVVAFAEDTACDIIRKVRPHIFVKGPDYLNIEIPEQKICKELNIKYIVAPQTKRFDTQKILEGLNSD